MGNFSKQKSETEEIGGFFTTSTSEPNFLHKREICSSFSWAQRAHVEYNKNPSNLSKRHAHESNAHCSEASARIRDGDHFSRYFLSQKTCLSLEHGASNKILSKLSIFFLSRHNFAPSRPQTKTRSLTFFGKHCKMEEVKRFFRASLRSFEINVASLSMREARTTLFPPGAAQTSRIFFAPTNGNEHAQRTLALSKKYDFSPPALNSTQSVFFKNDSRRFFQRSPKYSA